MRRIDVPSAAASLPTVPAASTEGFFTNGNPGTGTPATEVPDWWLNMVQEELRAVVVAGGVTPDKADLTQLRQAVRRMASSNVSATAATGTLTADQAGIVTIDATAGPITLTLPAANVAGGAPISFTFVRGDTTANAVAVQRAGSDFIDGVTFYPIPVGGRITLRSFGTNSWHVVSEVSLGRSLASPGWYRMPGGLILQWGSVGWGAAALPDFGGSWAAAAPQVNVSITFPITFPNVCWMICGSGGDVTGGNDGLEAAVAFSSVTTSGATARATRISGNNAGVDVGSIRYIALGG